MKKQFTKPQQIFLLGNVLFGAVVPLGKILLQHMPLSIFLLPKYLIPGLITLIAAIYLKRWKKLTRRQLIRIGVLGLVNVTLSNLMFYAALQRVPVGYSMLVPLLTPMVVYGLAIIILKEKLQITALIGVIVSLSGVVLLFFSHIKITPSIPNVGIYGELLLLGSLLLGGLGTIYSKDIMKDIHILQFVTLQLLFGSIPLVFYFAYGLNHFVISSIPASTWWLLALVCLIVTPLGYLTFYGPIRDLNLEENANQIYVQTVIGVLLGVVLLREPLGGIYIISMAIVAFGVWLGRQRFNQVWAYLLQPRHKLKILEIIKDSIARLGIRI